MHVVAWRCFHLAAVVLVALAPVEAEAQRRMRSISRIDPARQAASNSHPAVSPDGQRIAFDSNRTGDREIYVMRSDGWGAVRLTNSPSTDLVPSWSADGTRVFFQSNRGGETNIWSVPADASEPPRLESSRPPNLSPDGVWALTVIDVAGNLDIYRVHIVDGTRIRITDSPDPDTAPQWAFDGDRVV